MEIDYNKLKKLGITDDGKKKHFCPECHTTRTDKRDKSLSVDWDKCIAHCHYCGKNFFFNKADFGIAIERDRTKDVTRVHVQKVKFRHLGQPGVASFQYNTCCGRFTPMVEGKTPDIPDEDPKWDNSNWLAKKQPEQKRLDI